ncbi:histone deacetylase HDA2/Rpd3p [Cryptosporidium canis]|uniref:Histone deacetylase n=1 Tax=Cryptosporidium canis TaxID=195482 RepID=A0A9D5DHV7_9CRYT|nr:histone deacetylase HDA2/Rpd3p [Cryptosporidium canis]
MGTNKKIAYFYDEEVGNFHYGLGHPMKPHRVRMTHDLVSQYGLLENVDVMVPVPGTVESLTRFHSNDYVDFLRSVNTDNMHDYSDHLARFNVGEDCPVFDGLWEFCQLSAGGSLGGAQSVNEFGYQYAINWAGGLHHGKKHEASGFCYVNDCVLGALEFLKYQHRVCYVDIDIHHGDGVEEAFYTSPRCMCVSFHKYGDYFPGTGAINDVGVEEGLGYSVNVPLKDGVDDATFMDMFTKVMTLVMENYRPGAIVLQCGADSLSGDRLGCFNLSLKGHGHAVSFLKKFDVPMLILGGGGYTLRNVPKCWAYETSLIVDKYIDEQLPNSSNFYGYYGPDFSLAVRTSNMENLNSRQDCEEIYRKISENFREHVFPVGSQISAYDVPEKLPQLFSYGEATEDLKDGNNLEHEQHQDLMDEMKEYPSMDCNNRAIG